LAYNSLIIKKIFDYINNKKLEKLESVLDFGDQDLNISFEDMVNNLKKNKINFSEKKFEALKQFPKRPRVPASTLWLTLGFKAADRIDLNKLVRKPENNSDGKVYEIDLNYELSEGKIEKKYHLVTDFGNNEHVFNIAQAFKTSHQLCSKNGLIWIIQNLYGANGFYNFDLSYFELMAASNSYLIEDSFMIIKKENIREIIPINADIFKKLDLNKVEEIQVSYLFRKQNDESFKFSYQGIGDSVSHDKFYELNDNSQNYDLKRFYIPRRIGQIRTKILIKEIINRIKRKFFK